MIGAGRLKERASSRPHVAKESQRVLDSACAAPHCSLWSHAETLGARYPAVKPLCATEATGQLLSTIALVLYDSKGVSTLGDAQSLLGLTSKIPP